MALLSASGPSPSYEQAMLSLSRRLRRRARPPESRQYSELGLSTRPAMVPAALGRPPPPRAAIRGRFRTPAPLAAAVLLGKT